MGVVSEALVRVFWLAFFATAYRIFLILSFWIFAPSALFVVAAWVFLTDSDFGLWLRNCLPGESLRAQYYFRNKVVWIIGASSGVGKSLAVRICRNGGYVILSARNREELDAVAGECSRAHLVEGIRLCHRSESRIANVIDDAPKNPRTKVLPLDFQSESSVTQAVKLAEAWRGRIDAVYCMPGSLERAESPPLESEIKLFSTDVYPKLRLLRIILSSFFNSNACLHEPTLSYEEREEEIEAAKEFPMRLPSVEAFAKLREMQKQPHRSLPGIVRQASVAGYTRGAEVVADSWAGQLFRKWVLGEVTWKRRCNVIFPISADARLARPGSVALGAAHAALANYVDGAAREFRVAGLRQRHSSELCMSVVLIGSVATNALHNCILSDGMPCGDDAEVAGIPLASEPGCLTADRAAELMIRVARDGMREAWLAKGATLWELYLHYYVPWIHGFAARRLLDQSYADAVQQFNQAIHR